MPQPKGHNGLSVQAIVDDAVLCVTVDATEALARAGRHHADVIAGLQRIAPAVNGVTAAIADAHQALDRFLATADRAREEQDRRLARLGVCA